MNNSYPKACRITKSHHYRRVLLKGEELRGKLLILCAFQNSKEDITQFGVVASRHFGNATKRNRFKRLSREAFRLSKGTFPKGLQLILKPRKYALYASMQDILEELALLSNHILEKKA